MRKKRPLGKRSWNGDFGIHRLEIFHSIFILRTMLASPTSESRPQNLPLRKNPNSFVSPLCGWIVGSYKKKEVQEEGHLNNPYTHIFCRGRVGHFHISNIFQTPPKFLHEFLRNRGVGTLLPAFQNRILEADILHAGSGPFFHGVHCIAVYF